jgi:hypothetical protein
MKVIPFPANRTAPARRTAKLLEAFFRAQLEEMDVDWSRSGLTIEERVEVRKAEFCEWLEEEYGISFWFG